jgi:hypothetical protein
MSPKQQVYQEMLRLILPSLRNAQTLPWWRKARDKGSAYDSELIHNLYVSLFEPEFTSHDIHFLNVQARWYYENAKGKAYHYKTVVELISKLMHLVPPDQREKLQWQLE